MTIDRINQLETAKLSGPVWKPIDTAPRNGEWFIARTRRGGLIRIVHFDDQYDRFPISNDQVIWTTAPMEWTELNSVLSFVNNL